MVLVDHGPAAADIEQCRGSGVPLIVGDATDPRVVRRARIDWASHVVAVTGDDGVNTEVARQAANIAGTEAAPLDVYVNVNDEELSRLLNKEAIFRSDLPLRPVKHRFFNVKQFGPRALLSDHPELLTGKDHQPPSILVIGTGPIGVYFAVEASRQHRWEVHSGEEPPLQIALADVDAEAKVAAMKSCGHDDSASSGQYPRFRIVVNVVTLPLYAQDCHRRR